MGLRGGDEGGGRVDAEDGAGLGESGGGFGEDAGTGADVEDGERGWGRVRRRGEEGREEFVPERVHEVQEAGGALGVPPGGGEAGEVGDFGGGDGG